MNHISATNLSFFSQIVGIFKIGEGIDHIISFAIALLYRFHCCQATTQDLKFFVHWSEADFAQTMLNDVVLILDHILWVDFRLIVPTVTVLWEKWLWNT
jgi:hypothetical protein